MNSKTNFCYATVLIAGIFFFSSLALAQEKQKMEISKQLRERVMASIVLLQTELEFSP